MCNCSAGALIKYAVIMRAHIIGARAAALIAPDTWPSHVINAYPQSNSVSTHSHAAALCSRLVGYSMQSLPQTLRIRTLLHACAPPRFNYSNISALCCVEMCFLKKIKGIFSLPQFLLTISYAAMLGTCAYLLSPFMNFALSADKMFVNVVSVLLLRRRVGCGMAFGAI